MLRFFYILFLSGKYLSLFLLIKLKIIDEPRHKLLRNFFEDAGGSFVKFGQLLSLRVDVISKEFALEMLNLLDNVRPFPYHFVEEIFIQELGAKPDKIFKDFQKESFASASFGQVHGAKLADNTIVAVKILRPGIENKIAVDFFLINIFAFIADLFFRIDALPWKEFAKEYKKWTLQEIDYHIEAEHGERLYKHFEGDKNIVVPKIYHHLSTRRILVTGYIEGVHLSRVLRGLKDGRLNYEKLKKMGIDIKKAPKTLSQSIMYQYFFFRVFHADPHPGNIILLPDDKIGLIDFGIIGEALPGNQKALIKTLQSFANLNFKDAIFYFVDLVGEDLRQMLGSALPANVDQKHLDNLMRELTNEYALSVEKIAIENEEKFKDMKKDYAIELLRLIKGAKKYQIKLPKQTVIFVRTLSIIALMAKQLDREFLFVDQIKEFFIKFPEDSIPVPSNTTIPYQRLSHERALEKLNTWLACLIEIDPKTYHLVNNYIKKYNLDKIN